jgi:hypothetical protein
LAGDFNQQVVVTSFLEALAFLHPLFSCRKKPVKQKRRVDHKEYPGQEQQEGDPPINSMPQLRFLRLICVDRLVSNVHLFPGLAEVICRMRPLLYPVKI